MAVVTAFTSLNLPDYQQFEGPTVLGSNQITVTVGSRVGTYTGQFEWDNGGVFGTIVTYEEYAGDLPYWSVTALSLDARGAFALINGQAVQSLFGIAFAGNDTFKGSAGDDTFSGFAGNDIFDGGGGFNTAVYASDSKNYSISMNLNGQAVVSDRTGVEGQDTMKNMQALEFHDTRVDLGRLVQATQLDDARFDDLVSLYIAYFNRAPDALGISYWASRMVEGMSLPEIAASFFVQPETIATYPPGLGTEAFVTKVYGNVLGRAPDAPGLAYWMNDLEHNNLPREVFVLAIINGARAETGGPVDAAYLDNKESVGSYFARTRGLSDVAWAADTMAEVSANNTSVLAAMDKTDAYFNLAATAAPHLLLPILGVIEATN